MEHVESWVLASHAIATLMMGGLIWFVQIVHYPMFANVGAEAFSNYERIHQQRTTRVVGPLMLVELVTAVWIALAGFAAFWPAWIGVGLVGLLWLSTAAVQVPLHRRLSGGYDAAVGRALVRTNWLRTIAWSGRGGLAVWMLLRATG